MNVSALRNQVNNGKVAAIKIMSNEGDIYTAQAVVGNELHTLNLDESGKPWVFHSYVEAKRALSSCAVPIALETSTVYDEMVNSHH